MAEGVEVGITDDAACLMDADLGAGPGAVTRYAVYVVETAQRAGASGVARLAVTTFEDDG